MGLRPNHRSEKHTHVSSREPSAHNLIVNFRKRVSGRMSLPLADFQLGVLESGDARILSVARLRAGRLPSGQARVFGYPVKCAVNFLGLVFALYHALLMLAEGIQTTSPHLEIESSAVLPRWLPELW